MPRATPRQLAALVAMERRYLDVLAAAGRTVEPEVHAGLDAIAAHARGEKSLKAARVATWRKLDAMAERFRIHGRDADRSYMWGVGAIGTLARMAATGEDYGELVVTHTSYAVDSLGKLTTTKPSEVAGWYAEALTEVGELSDAPAKVRARAAKVVAAETAALARAAKALGARGAKLLASRGVHFAPKQAATAATLTALLRKRGYPVHRAVLAFEAAFGGLLAPELDTDIGDLTDWLASGPWHIIGPYACIKASGHDGPDGGLPGLVPVVYTVNDGILFLDGKGRPYYQDTIEDAKAKAAGRDGASALARLLTRM